MQMSCARSNTHFIVKHLHKHQFGGRRDAQLAHYYFSIDWATLHKLSERRGHQFNKFLAQIFIKQRASSVVEMMTTRASARLTVPGPD